jgi:hypothetical protein
VNEEIISVVHVCKCVHGKLATVTRHTLSLTYIFSRVGLVTNVYKVTHVLKKMSVSLKTGSGSLLQSMFRAGRGSDRPCTGSGRVGLVYLGPI